MVKRRNGPRTPDEVCADIHAAPARNRRPAQAGPEMFASLSVVQRARDLEAQRGRTAPIPEGALVLQRLLIAMLEAMTPEQRVEVYQRLV